MLLDMLYQPWIQRKSVDIYTESKPIPLRMQPAPLQWTFGDLDINLALNPCHEFLEIADNARLLPVLVRKEGGTLSPPGEHGHHAV